MLNWAQRFNTFCFLDNHQYQIEPHAVECILAAGVRRSVEGDAGNALEKLQNFINDSIRSDVDTQTGSWLFGHLGYDLKNEIESLSSSHPDRIGFPGLYFFEPEIVIRFSETEMIIEASNPEKVFEEINAALVPVAPAIKQVSVENRISKKACPTILFGF